jgi:predicted transcriptional regulator
MNNNDGYLQTKIREQNEQLKTVDEHIKLMQNMMGGFDRKIGEYETLIAELKDHEKYVEKLRKELTDVFKEFCNHNIKDDIEKTITKALGDHVDTMKGVSERASTVVKTFSKDLRAVHEDFLKLASSISELVLKLVQKKIISSEDGEKIIVHAFDDTKNWIAEHGKDFDRFIEKMQKRKGVK